MGQIAVGVGLDVRPAGEQDTRTIDVLEVELDTDLLERRRQELGRELAKSRRQRAVLEDERRLALRVDPDAIGTQGVPGRVERGVRGSDIEGRAGRIRERQ